MVLVAHVESSVFDSFFGGVEDVVPSSADLVENSTPFEHGPRLVLKS
jgi:hypothetical protein